MDITDFVTLPAGWATAIIVVDYLVKIVALGTVPENRHPASSQAWLLAILLVPVVGVPLFLMIGSPYVTGKRNRIQERANSLYAEELAGWPTVPEGLVVDDELRSVLHMNRALTAMPCTTGEFVALHDDYAVSIAAMTEAVAEARDRVHVQFYAQSLDDETRAFYDALVDAARRGVTVRVLVDHLGSLRYRGFGRLRRRLRREGVEMHLMLPVNPFAGRFRRPDLRNHRKLLLVDARRGFVGSQNLIDRCYGSARNAKLGREWHDVMAEVRGEVVDSLEAVFAVDWFTESDERIDHMQQLVEFDHPPVGGAVNAFQVVPSGPGYRTEPNMRMFTQLVAHATTRIAIVSPYFVPNTTLLDTLTSAAYRGVDVEVFVPEKADQFMVHHAQRSYFRALLEAGVRIHRYPPPAVLHTKMLVVDDEIGVIGSSNMDMRSFMLNFEISLLVFGGDALAEMTRVVDGYRDVSGELDLETWQRRPWPGRYVDNVARLTSALQ